jgi:spore coat protein U-like protein
MTKRFLAASIVILSALGAPATAAQLSSSAAIKVVKPLKLTKLQDLDFGTVTLDGSPGPQTISISQAGVVTCPATLVCAGAPSAARFNLQGSSKATVIITVPNVNLSNGFDTIAFTANAPATINLPNSGNQGVDIGIGGSVTVTDTAAGGVYTGTVTVTAEYQ